MREAFTSGCALTLVSWLAASCASAPRTPVEPGGSPATQPAASGTIQSTPAGGASHAPPSVKLFNKTVIYIKDAYFDPARINPRQMLVAALRSVARAAPQLRVETLEPDKLRLTSGEESRTFDLAPIDSLWKMSFLFFDIYKWLTGPLGIADPSAEVGFAATNGMLSTLDPHSLLLTQKWYEAASKPCPSCVANPPVPLLTSHMLSPGIGYIRLGSLPRIASSELRRALTDLSQTTERGGQLRGVVLDLRGNQGGLLEEAVRVTNLFVEDGVVVKTVALGGKQLEDRRATKSAAVTRAPVVVVVDEVTAAGAEIIAAAFKDLDRAVIVGQRTRGAGTVQVLYEYGDTDGIGKAYLKLTIAAMLRSSGTPIDELGVVPDVVLQSTGAPASTDAGTPDPTTRRPTAERSLAELTYPRGKPTPVDAPFAEDFPIRFAHDLLLRAPSVRRSDMLPHAKALAAEQR